MTAAQNIYESLTRGITALLKRVILEYGRNGYTPPEAHQLRSFIRLLGPKVLESNPTCLTRELSLSIFSRPLSLYLFLQISLSTSSNSIFYMRTRTTRSASTCIICALVYMRLNFSLLALTVIRKS